MKFSFYFFHVIISFDEVKYKTFIARLYGTNYIKMDTRLRGYDDFGSINNKLRFCHSRNKLVPSKEGSENPVFKAPMIKRNLGKQDNPIILFNLLGSGPEIESGWL
jgi:hypothetical protein